MRAPTTVKALRLRAVKCPQSWRQNKIEISHALAQISQGRKMNFRYSLIQTSASEKIGENRGVGRQQITCKHFFKALSKWNDKCLATKHDQTLFGYQTSCRPASLDSVWSCLIRIEGRQTLSELEVFLLLEGMDKTKSFGFHKIHPFLLQSSAIESYQPLTFIINLSLKTGVFSLRVWK